MTMIRISLGSRFANRFSHRPPTFRTVCASNTCFSSSMKRKSHPVLLHSITTHHNGDAPKTYRNASRKHQRQWFSSLGQKKHKFIPRKAAIQLKPSAREFCKTLLENAPEDVIGIMLKYQMSSQGNFGMVFSFEFARIKDIGPDDESVSLEVLEDGTPKPPSESINDGLKKLYVHHTAFMKVLGGTLDVKIESDGSFMPIIFDREGNKLDPNE